MKINKLHLTNFRSHANTELEFERLNVVRGLNHTGKSSIQMAIEYALTQRCLVTDAGGRGAEALIRQGASELRVSLELQSGQKILASRNQAGGSLLIGNGKQMLSGKIATSWIASEIAPLPCLSAVLNSGHFLEMSANDQRNLLSQILLPADFAVPVEIDADIKALGVTFDWLAGNLLEVLDRGYKTFFDHRTEVNRGLKTLGEVEEPDVPRDMPTKESVKQQLDKLQAELGAKQKERQQILGDHSSRKQKYDAAIAKKGANEGKILDDETVARFEKALKSASKFTELARDADKIAIEIRTRDAALLAIDKLGASCPTCSRQLLPEDKKAIKDALAKELTLLRGQLEDIQARQRKLGDPVEAQKAMEAHRAAIAADVAADQAIKEIGSIGEAPSTFEIDGEIESLQLRISKGQDVLVKVSELIGRKQEYERYEKKRQTLTAQLEPLERLIKFFSPSGIKAKLMQERVGGFEAAINRSLDRFGYACRLSMEPYSIAVREVSPDDRGWLSTHQLSESEQFRFAIAFQVALAEATGVNLVVIDRADMLDTESRRQLTQQLLESNLDQAFILTTGDSSPAPEIPDTCFYDLESMDGVTTAILNQRTKEVEIYDAAAVN